MSKAQQALSSLHVMETIPPLLHLLDSSFPTFPGLRRRPGLRNPFLVLPTYFLVPQTSCICLKNLAQGRGGGPNHGTINLQRSIGQNWCMTASFLLDMHAEEKLSSTWVSRFYTISTWAQSWCHRDSHIEQMAGEKPHALNHYSNKHREALILHCSQLVLHCPQSSQNHSLCPTEYCSRAPAMPPTRSSALPWEMGTLRPLEVFDSTQRLSSAEHSQSEAPRRWLNPAPSNVVFWVRIPCPQSSSWQKIGTDMAGQRAELGRDVSALHDPQAFL